MGIHFKRPCFFTQDHICSNATSIQFLMASSSSGEVVIVKRTGPIAKMLGNKVENNLMCSPWLSLDTLSSVYKNPPQDKKNSNCVCTFCEYLQENVFPLFTVNVSISVR